MEYASYACNTQYSKIVHEWEVQSYFKLESYNYVLLLHCYYVQGLL